MEGIAVLRKNVQESLNGWDGDDDERGKGRGRQARGTEDGHVVGVVEVDGPVGDAGIVAVVSVVELGYVVAEMADV